MKVLVSDPKNLNYLDYDIDGIIIGLKSFSYGFEKSYTPSDIAKIKTDKKIFVSLNKMVHNNELSSLKDDLIALESINVSGVFFDDLAILNIVKENNLNLNLIWAGAHLVNNYATINHYASKMVKGALLSNELNEEEIKTITTKAEASIFMQVYGYTNISYSYRHLLSNYCNFLDKEKASGNYFLTVPKVKGKFPIIEEEDGTFIYSSLVCDITGKLDNLKIDYAILNNYLINEDDFTKILTKFLKGEKIDVLEANLGFLEKEVIIKNKEVIK